MLGIRSAANSPKKKLIQVISTGKLIALLLPPLLLLLLLLQLLLLPPALLSPLVAIHPVSLVDLPQQVSQAR